MHTAPRDGTNIQVRRSGEWWVAHYWDCDDLNDGTEDAAIKDCWAVKDSHGPGCIELREAEGWLLMDEFPDDFNGPET